MHSAMEQTRYWMWTKRKLSGTPLHHSLTPPVAAAGGGGSSYHGSWEEQAFAEDSAGHLGGCVWPPRSYLCNFCRREFRSAQALGGHMNVHRRDRARLKLSSSSPSNENHDADLHHHINPCTLLGTQYPSQVSTLVYSSKSNPNLGVISSTHSPSRVSAPCTQESFSNYTLVSPSCPPSIIEGCRKESVLSNPQPISDLLPIGPLTVLELKLGRENWRLREVGCEDDEETISRKRRKTDPIFPLFMKPSLTDQELLQSETKKLKPSHIEELDLELRLGDPPKVK